ncbi:S-layer homology domain-containing protein, partial [Candidatus Saganbacteria bacterium]|nr:S-layer homology domain-containing protein [Candidatus Saganbacteria bacterium]
LNLGLELDIPNSVLSSGTSALYHAGLEYSPVKNIALRAGLNQEAGGNGFTMGLGLTNGGFRFDYAYVQRPGLPGDIPHYFTLSYVGEKSTIVSRKLKRVEPSVKFYNPANRLITDQDSVAVSAEVRAVRVMDQKTVWSIAVISATEEIREVSEIVDLTGISLNGKIIGSGQPGTIETVVSLEAGRNVIAITGRTPDEHMAASSEIKVLRFAPFSDAPINYWAIKPIALLVTLDIVKGFPRNLFMPEKGITRAELVTLLVRSLNISQQTLNNHYLRIFNDVPLSHWANKFVGYGSSVKFAAGYPDGTFKPDKTLTRAEGVVILARYAGLNEAAISISPFTDLKLNFWANKHIAAAKAAGMLKYLEGQEFSPDRKLTRAEACEILYRVPLIKNKVDRFWETGLTSGTQ